MSSSTDFLLLLNSVFDCLTYLINVCLDVTPQVAVHDPHFLGRPDLVDQRLEIALEADSFEDLVDESIVWCEHPSPDHRCDEERHDERQKSA